MPARNFWAATSFVSCIVQLNKCIQTHHANVWCLGKSSSADAACSFNHPAKSIVRQNLTDLSTCIHCENTTYKYVHVDSGSKMLPADANARLCFFQTVAKLRETIFSRERMPLYRIFASQKLNFSQQIVSGRYIHRVVRPGDPVRSRYITIRYTYVLAHCTRGSKVLSSN
jgi:hypothetical protein